MRETLEAQIQRARLRALEEIYIQWEARSPWYKIIAARVTLNFLAVWYTLREWLGVPNRDR
jgi:hypothetical protein